MSVLFWSFPGAGRIGVAATIVAALIFMSVGVVGAVDEPQQPSGFGFISANGIAPLPPPGSPINVELAADDAVFRVDPLHQQARLAATRVLEGWGYEVTDQGAPILRIAVSMAPGPVRVFESPVGARPHMQPGEIAPIPDSSRVPLLEPQVRVPLGPLRRRATGSYTVTIMLFERGREPSWTATSSASGTFPQPEALVRTLTRTAMNDFGRSVQREFILSCVEEDVAQGGICPE